MNTTRSGDVHQALQQYADEGLDQWEAWRFDTAHGPVYVRITRELPPSETDDGYERVIVSE